ncbi:MAG: MbnP family protein [Bacteroidota bacterium]
MRLLVFLMLWVVLQACYEEQEGCLDRNATNYEVDADFECAERSCCDYPRLGIRYTPLWGVDTLDNSLFYQDGLGNDFRLDRLRFYISEVQLQQRSGDTLTPQNPIEFGLELSPGDTTFSTLNSNLALVRSQVGDRWNVGDFIEAVDATALYFRLGLQAPYSFAVPETMSSDHPLARQEGLLNFSDGLGYLMGKLEFSLVSTPGDTLAREINFYGNESIQLPLAGGVVLPGGNNLTIDLGVDYQALLSSLDLAADSLILVDELRMGLPQVFTYTDFNDE